MKVDVSLDTKFLYIKYNGETLLMKPLNEIPKHLLRNIVIDIEDNVEFTIDNLLDYNIFSNEDILHMAYRLTGVLPFVQLSLMDTKEYDEYIDLVKDIYEGNLKYYDKYMALIDEGKRFKRAIFRLRDTPYYLDVFVEMDDLNKLKSK